jgi:hypothetical protein
MLRSSDGEIFGVGSQGPPVLVKINTYSSYYYYTSTPTLLKYDAQTEAPKAAFPATAEPDISPTAAPTACLLWHLLRHQRPCLPRRNGRAHYGANSCTYYGANNSSQPDTT